MLRAQVVLALALCIGCGDNTSPQPDAATHREVTVLRAVPNHALDLLFVIEDTELDKVTNLKSKIGEVKAMLASLDPPVYDVHVGVVTTDLGTVGSLDPSNPAPGIGSGPGSCWGVGKDGRLQTNATPLLDGLFVHERLDANGTLTTNYTSTFEQVMAAILSVGASGCGFEQPLAATKRALANDANAGFVREHANLGVILFLEEDDCSVRDAGFFTTDTSILGPLQSFRCTQWGIECNEDITTFGLKSGCRPRQGSPYIEDVASIRDALLARKPDPRQLAVTAIMGNPDPLEVEPRTPPGGGIPIPALAHSCMYNGTAGPEVADPAKRVEFFLDGFPPETSTDFASICDQDLGPALRRVTASIKKTLGDPCIDTRSLRDTDPTAPGIQPSCAVEDVSDAAPSQPVAIAPCPADGGCFELVVDERACPYQPEHLKLVVHRVAAPGTDVWMHVRCELE